MNNLPTIVAGLWVFGIIGWILNLVWLVQDVTGQTFGQLDVTAMLILQVVGVFFAPLGSILGYIGIFI